MSKRDEVGIWIWTTGDVGAPEFADRFLETLRSVGEHWVPQRFGPHEPLRYHMASDGEAAFRAMWMNTKDPEYPIAHLLFATDRTLGVRGAVKWARGWNHDFNIVSLSAPLRTYTQFGEEFWRVVLALFATLDAAYGTVRADSEYEQQHRNPGSGDSYLGVKLGPHIPGVYYGNLFGRVIVRFFGEDRLQSCPAVRNERLSGGGWLLTTADNPSDWDTVVARRARDAVRSHLGERAFFDIRSPDRRTIHPFFDFSAVRVGSEGSTFANEPPSNELLEDAAAVQEFVERVLIRCDHLARRVRPVALDYSPASLVRAESALEGLVRDGPDRREIVLEVASYFGEVVRRNLEGAWTRRLRCRRCASGTVAWSIQS
jgi:hypothetical protein